jgi:hypothetical protein
VSREIYVVEIGEVIVNGARVPRSVFAGASADQQRSELRALLHDAIARELQTAALPAGRAVRTAVTVRASGPAGGAEAVAANVGRAVAGAIGGRSSRG